MPELLRTLAAHLRTVIANRRRAQRKRLRLPCAVSIYEAKPAANAQRRVQALEVYTRDLSSTGIALVAPAIRIGGHYLTNSILLLMLEHPAGSIEIVAQPVRYEQLPSEGDEAGYLIGTHIISMSDDDRALYEEYLRELK
ncbi:MAG: PilZ domain-containing protein [Pyrinomonadaceae bacterium]